jgi:hypothetical protein
VSVDGRVAEPAGVKPTGGDDAVLYEPGDSGIAVLTFNRPERMRERADDGGTRGIAGTAWPAEPGVRSRT